MRYYIIAGEKSGDIYGGRLVQALRQMDSQAVCRAWGGQHMHQAGAELVVHYTELAVMGLRILGKLKKLFKYLRYCQEDICQFQPDAVILIDYSGFNLRIAKFAKKRHLATFYYIPPKVWAWNTRRIYQLKAYVDKVFSIFPFEKEFYAQHGYHAVDYVGNPLLEEIVAYNKNPRFLASNGLDRRPIIALLPGSRIQEIKTILPKMLAIAPLLPTHQFVIAGISELSSELYNAASHMQNVAVIYDQMHDVLSHASMAIVTSGTATLEASYLNVPQVVVYKTDLCTYYLARWLVKLKYISLVNILAKKEVVRELIQDQLTTHHLWNAIQEIMLDTEFRQQQLDGYQYMRDMLGKEKASINTAYSIIQYLVTKRC